MMQKCTSCGANVSPHDPACSYCGTRNPEYAPPEHKINQLLETGMDAFQRSQYAKAIDCYQQVIAIDADVFEAYFYLASAYSSLKRNEEAIKMMEKAQTIRPGNAAIAYNLGTLYKQLSRNAEARTYFEKALHLLQADPAVGEAQQQFRQRIESALAEYRQ